ncbi:hypothetical protein XA68_15025 [Ophiocordyceps unilateralis]|uniref:Uncharacterized protein n=1 Tax=Ophiocordyceps unilateralis TaxID=268505 RepID=A0A2A9P985_OPHUN|nr:hypothetical protein XA68_15025 [Ophiocordyceps unilateralis]
MYSLGPSFVVTFIVIVLLCLPSRVFRRYLRQLFKTHLKAVLDSPHLDASLGAPLSVYNQITLSPSSTPLPPWNESYSHSNKHPMMSAPADMGSFETVILNGPGDWRRWMAQIQRLASENGIWPLVDPSAADKPVLTRPCEPKASQVNPEAEGPEDLNGYEIHKLEFLYSAYRVQRMDFEKKERALSALNLVVVKTVGRYYNLVAGQQDVVASLALLKDRVQPSDWAIRMEARNRYRALLRCPDMSKIEDWVDSWQLALDEATALDLPDVQGLLPTQDFLQAVSSIDPCFATFWMQTIEHRALENNENWESSIPCGIKISEIFSRTARVNAAAKTPSTDLRLEAYPKCDAHKLQTHFGTLPLHPSTSSFLTGGEDPQLQIGRHAS